MGIAQATGMAPASDNSCNYKNSVEGGLKGGKASFHKKVSIHNENLDRQKQHRQWCLHAAATIDGRRTSRSAFSVLGWVPCEPWWCLYDYAVCLPLMRQVEPCLFTEVDHIVAHLKGSVGYPRFQCRHCNGHAWLGKYFPVLSKLLSTNLTSQNFHAHMLK